MSATDQAAPATFVLWLDASDGSVPTSDGVQWPDGWVTIRHRHYGHTTTHHSPEAACRAAHGTQGRIVWNAPADRAAVLREPTDDDVELLGQWLWDNCSEDERTGLLSDDPRRIAAMALRWPELRRVAAESAPAVWIDPEVSDSGV